MRMSCQSPPQLENVGTAKEQVIGAGSVWVPDSLD